MLWAACTTCFFGFLRSGEITVPLLRDFNPGAHLCVSDVTLDSRSAPPRIVQLNIKASKTDHSGTGCQSSWGRLAVVSSSSIGSISGNSWEPAGALLPVQRRSPSVMRTVCHQSQRGINGGGAGCIQVCRT